MQMEDILKVGIITSVHGVHGEVKVYPTTDDARRFKKLKEVLTYRDKEFVPLKILGVKLFKNMAILKFEGIDTPEAASGYRNRELFVTRENAVKLKKDEYFIADLIGIKVYDEDGELLGVLTEVMEGKANDVYVIEMKEKKELLIPALKQCILDVDIANMSMKVHVLEGLL